MNTDFSAALLQRLCDRDPIATAEACELLLPQLLADRRWLPSGISDPHIAEDAAHEALLDFVERPERYNPALLSVLPYLRMAARRNALNLIKRESRHKGRRAPLELVELHPPRGNEADEGSGLPSSVSQALLLRRLSEQVPDARDRAALALMLDQMRATSVYARIFGLEHLSPEEQRRTVKRHKDRLGKVMKRLGERLRDGK